jgi:hypothetical protein
LLQNITLCSNNMFFVLFLFQEGTFPSSRTRGGYSEAAEVL